MIQLTQFAAEHSGPHVSLAAEEIFNVAGVPVTNAILLGVLGYVVLLAVLLRAVYVVKKNKKRGFLTKLIVWGYEGLYKTVENIIGDKTVAKRLAPLPITLFFFIITQYYLGILPFVGPVTLHETPLFRGFAADLNTTFGLAIITLVTMQIYAIRAHGFFGNVKRFIKNPIKDPAGAFEGILEIIADFSRTVALSLRLFGNVFAGEVLLVMVGFLTSYFSVAALPPFYIFELFIGGIQAYIFFMLTTVFISLGLVSHDTHDEHVSDHSPTPKTAKAVPTRE
ncbi:MAG TPA: F0F1 ATP synthase subunit A [Candidatus Saccharimonadales bacterium]|nr:F0F1 ATP synthase subunit A [Candidatus Saccharimonadales bacterium]